jgi:predicted DNA-binding protein
MYNESMKKSERKTTIRLTDEAKELIERLSKKLGINKTAVIEQAVRVLAEKEKVKSE